MFPVIVVELIMLLALFTRTGGNVYTTSGMILANFQRKHKFGAFYVGRKSLKAKVLRSLPKLKVRF